MSRWRHRDRCRSGRHRPNLDVRSGWDSRRFVSVTTARVWIVASRTYRLDVILQIAAIVAFALLGNSRSVSCSATKSPNAPIFDFLIFCVFVFNELSGQRQRTEWVFRHCKLKRKKTRHIHIGVVNKLNVLHTYVVEFRSRTSVFCATFRRDPMHFLSPWFTLIFIKCSEKSTSKIRERTNASEYDVSNPAETLRWRWKYTKRNPEEFQRHECNYREHRVNMYVFRHFSWTMCFEQGLVVEHQADIKKKNKIDELNTCFGLVRSISTDDGTMCRNL